MGLDMMLYRAPRYKDATVMDIATIDGYKWHLEEGYVKNINEYCEKYNCTTPSKEILDFYMNYKGDLLDEVGYWRKANAIHAYFVDATQDGIDECQYSEVAPEVLEELLETCQYVLKNCKANKNGETITNEHIAQEHLPTQGGFFFGSTNYDQWYLDDLTNTVDIIQRVLWETNFEKEMIIYHASW